MDNFYTYILYSASWNKFYIGSTHNLELRLEHHNDGWTKSTKHGIPWKIVYFEKYTSKSEALKREREIKNMKSRKYIISLIEQ